VGPHGCDLPGVLSALVAALPEDERVALFERAPEVALGRRPAVCLKIGAEDIDALLEHVRHFRPDRLVMHALRETDLKPALLSFAQRHDGSLGSVECRCAKDALTAFDRAVGPDIVLRAAPVFVELKRSEGKTRIAAVHQTELDASGDLLLKPH
jgi:Flp pilus assembly CpaF family ATPase